MKKRLLISTVFLLALGGLAQAQDGNLHGVLDVTYQSKYLWRGIDVYGDKSAVQSSLDLDLFSTGFGLRTEAHRANSSGYENTERWDYTLYYQNMICPDDAHATAYMIGYRYFNFPDGPLAVPSPYSGDIDLQEMHAVLAWPKILPVKGLVPAYVLVKLWPANSDSFVGSQDIPGLTSGTASGFAHIFVLDYSIPIEGFTPETPEQVIRLHSEVVFNDGVDPRGIGVDHDWTNAVFGIATDFELVENVALTPAVYYQVTMDDSINEDQDETWFTLGMSYKF